MTSEDPGMAGYPGIWGAPAGTTYMYPGKFIASERQSPSAIHRFRCVIHLVYGSANGPGASGPDQTIFSTMMISLNH